ncbi:MAG: agmatine deiminase family protein [Phyllobacteriaceae bacterium]|nr:agmatine deiminase family protein [Phyllobacteriaceae bacterium]
MPEETEPHERTFMQWPVNRQVHPDLEFLALLQQTIADVANAIGEFEPVARLMDKAHEKAARKLLGGKVEIWDIATDDLWARDSGPAFVVDGKGGLALTQFNFNGWGGKQVHGHDGGIAARISERLGLQVFDNGLVGEAGGVEQDGDGTLIAHASCWVNPNRNAGSAAEVEAMLLDALGAQKMIWAPGVKGADITDYHIDALARFVRPGVVVIQMPEELDPSDPWSRSAFETHDILAKATDAKGRRLELVKLPEPVDIRVGAADFVSSYVNYYVCNGAVICAEFGDRHADAEAATILAGLYPGREIVALDIDAIGEVGGGIHCATQEQPEV